MKWSNVRLIFFREFRDQLRDRRTLFTIAILPLLLYPVLGMVVFQISQFRHEQPTRVLILGAEELPAEPQLIVGNQFAEGLLGRLALLELTVSDPLQGDARDETIQDLAQQELRSGRFDAVVYFPRDFAGRLQEFRQQVAQSRTEGQPPAEEQPPAPRSTQPEPSVGVPQPEIFVNAASDRSNLAGARLDQVLRNWRDSIIHDNLAESRIPAAVTQPFGFVRTDVSLEQNRRAAFWSKLLPFVVLIWALTGAFYPAIDVCAGEKERGTLETLLSSPAERQEIVWGKLLTVTVFSILTSLLNLTSMGMTGALFFRQLSSAESTESLAVGPPPLAAVAWLLLALIPIAALFSALSLAISAFARSSKEGQYYLMPLLLISLPLLMLPMMPSSQLDWGTSLVPVSGMMLLLQALVEGQFTTAARFCVPVLGVTGLCCLLAIRWAVFQFSNESVLFREGERWGLGLWLRNLVRDRSDLPTFGEGILCGVLLLVIRFFAGSLAGIPNSWNDFAVSTWITQLALIATPALLMAILLTRSPRRTLLLTRPRAATVPVAILLAVVIHPVALAFGSVVSQLYPIAQDVSEKIGEVTALVDQAPNFAAVILVMALVPAICEELAFRGFVLSGLRSGGQRWVAIVVSALFFGAVHSILQQSIAAFAVGLVIGYLAVQTRSLIPCVLFHLVYNTLSLCIGLALPRWIEDYPVLHLFFVRTNGNLGYDWPVVVAGGLVTIGLLVWLRAEVPSSDAPPREIAPVKLPRVAAVP